MYGCRLIGTFCLGVMLGVKFIWILKPQFVNRLMLLSVPVILSFAPFANQLTVSIPLGSI